MITDLMMTQIIETIIIHAINWAEHSYQEIKIVDIVSVVEV